METACVALSNALAWDETQMNTYCQSIEKDFLSKFQWPSYKEHLVSIKDASSENMMFLRKLGFTYKEMSQILHCAEVTLKKRLNIYRDKVDEAREVEAEGFKRQLNVNLDDNIEMLEAKKQVLHSISVIGSDDNKIKAIKVLMEVTNEIVKEREKLVKIENMKKVISLFQKHINELDVYVKAKFNDINATMLNLGQDKIYEIRGLNDVIRESMNKDPDIVALKRLLFDEKAMDGEYVVAEEEFEEDDALLIEGE